ncbi:hypothetical protein HYY75_04620, partial [bacterium]|nr:hypothetical protein [bacterium]
MKNTLITLVFAVFPIIVLQVAIWQVEQLEVEKKIRQKWMEHERLLAKLNDADDQPGMVGRSIRKFFDQMRKIPPSERQSELRKLFRLYPNTIDLYIFSPSGKVIGNLSSKRHSHRAIGRVFGAMVQDKNGKQMSAGETGLLNAILNSSVGLDLLRYSGRIMILGKRDTDGFAGWDFTKATNEDDLGGYFALIHPRGFIPDRTLKLSIQWLNRRWKQTKFGYVDIATTPIRFNVSNSLVNENFLNDVLVAISGYNRHIRRKNCHVSLALRKGNGYLLAISPLPVFFPEWFSLAVNISCLLWFSLVFHGVAKGEQTFSIRIPFKLVGLFIFAVGTPAIILLIG